MQYNYETLKLDAAAHGIPVTSLLALTPANDPFYAGTPADVRNGNWFRELWDRFGFTTGVHIRRMHYRIISQREVVLMPNGQPYENTDYCWNFITQAAKIARYLEFVDIDAFVDRRNPEPQIFNNWGEPEPQIEVAQNLGMFTAPAFPDRPYLYLYGYGGVQRTDIVVMCEKSTMNDVLVPLCERYSADLVTGVGELSITAVANLMQRLRPDGFARILYISDFDPAGMSMPVAVARKVEYFQRVRDYAELDIKLWPIALTARQVVHYRLPRTPIKESEKRAAKFEERHGDGAVELDALEALYPGELARIVEDQLRHFYDRTLYRRVEDARREVEERLREVTQGVYAQREAEYLALQTEYAALTAEFNARFDAFAGRLTTEWSALAGLLQTASANILSEHAIPEAYEPDDPDGPLYDSYNDYYSQIDEYRRFQGKT